MVMRMIPRRALPFLAAPALAQPWAPSRPVRIIAGWPGGGAADASLRLVTPHMQAALGQPVVIENRPGASGSIGAAAVAQAAPDGLTLLFDAAGQVSNPFLMRGLSFDYLTAFTPVTVFALLPNLLVVRSDAPFRTVADLVAHLRANPGREAFASTGIGIVSHLAGVMFAARERLVVTHVPYRASNQSIPGLLAGETLYTFNTTPLAAPLVREGRLRALAVTTPTRIPAFPDVPTMIEQGYEGFSINEWIGLFAPAGTPATAVQRHADAAAQGLADPTVRERHALLGMEIVANGPAAMAAFLAEQRGRIGALIRDNDIRLEG